MFSLKSVRHGGLLLSGSPLILPPPFWHLSTLFAYKLDAISRRQNCRSLGIPSWLLWPLTIAAAAASNGPGSNLCATHFRTIGKPPRLFWPRPNGYIPHLPQNFGPDDHKANTYEGSVTVCYATLGKGRQDHLRFALRQCPFCPFSGPNILKYDFILRLLFSTYIIPSEGFLWSHCEAYPVLSGFCRGLKRRDLLVRSHIMKSLK